MKNFLLLLCFISSTALTAATVNWDGGAGTTNWMDAMNWDTDALPTTADDVYLDGVEVVLTANTQVQRVYAGGSTMLTIDAGVTLTIDGFAGDDEGIEVQTSATLINNGIINISNLPGTNADGFYNKGTSTNNGTIAIDGIGQHGLYVVAGTFTNSATGVITITNIGLDDSASDYIYVDDANSGTLFGTLDNNGTITISVTTADHGVYVNDGSTLNNNGNITISKATGATAGDDGLAVEDNGTFNNNSGGVLTINSIQDSGIVTKSDGTVNNNFGGTINIDAVDNDQIQLDETTTFNNAGVINLTNSNDVGLYVTDASTFTNMSTGEVNVTDAVDHGVYVQGNTLATATIMNDGTITVNGGGASSDGLRLNTGGSVTNSATGNLLFNDIGADGIQMDANTTLNNSGNIIIDGVSTAASSNQEAMHMDASGATFNNMAGALFKALNSPDDGLQVDSGCIVNNDGDIRIDLCAGEAIETFAGFTFNNTSNATFAPGSSPGEFELKGDLDLGTSTTTFEINGTTHTTQYDRIENFTGSTLTITNAIAHLDWGAYMPAVGEKYTIIDGSGLVSGTFASITSSNPSIVYTVDYSDATEVEIEVTEVLPVELASFNGRIENTTTYLSWETYSESNNDYFVIEHSIDGRNFTMLNKVYGNGTTSTISNYSYTHEQPARMDNYYRLKQVDYDGGFEYSSVLHLLNEINDTPVDIYPNPARDVLIYEGAAATLTFYNMFGTQVMQQSTAGKSNIDISQLNAGTYIIEIHTGANEKTTKRFIKK